jgi:hypothetical protein
MQGSVLYNVEAEVKAFFPQPTIIDPGFLHQIYHAHLHSEASKKQYRVEGKMPADFHQRLVAAIKKNVLLEPKKKREILGYIGESL